MGDLDLGDMFLYFPLHERLQQFYGIELNSFFDDVQAWER
jgi:hypothetical protein